MEAGIAPATRLGLQIYLSTILKSYVLKSPKSGAFLNDGNLPPLD